MMTLRQFAAEPATIPMNTSWYLADLSEARGKQELYTRHAPQMLQALHEHTLVESAISSNRIEGIEVDKTRVATLIFGHSSLNDRDEEEVRGYRDALKLIHEDGAKLPISETTIKQLHRHAHHEMVLAVEQCYRAKPFTSDEERLEYLFKLYEEMIRAEGEE